MKLYYDGGNGIMDNYKDSGNIFHLRVKQYRVLKIISEKTDTPIGELVRRAVDLYIEKRRLADSYIEKIERT